jgi:hypothetical protein
LVGLFVLFAAIRRCFSSCNQNNVQPSLLSAMHTTLP